MNTETPDRDIEEMKEASIRRVIGPTIILGSGRYFDFENPEQSPMTIEDIAYGLAFTCRFAGQSYSRRLGMRVFYSVAEHCVRMSRLVPANLAYDALMHELGEQVCGDMTGPLKSMLPEYKAIEKRCERAVQKQFGVQMSDPNTIKLFDLRMLATERREVLNWQGETWGNGKCAEPFENYEITPWSPGNAADIFIDTFYKLKPKWLVKNGW